MQAAGRAEERRVDPEDGQARTFEELRGLCAGSYSEQEIREYWERACKPTAERTSDAAADRKDPLLAYLRPEGGRQRPRGALDGGSPAPLEAPAGTVPVQVPRPAPPPQAGERGRPGAGAVGAGAVGAGAVGAGAVGVGPPDCQEDPFLMDSEPPARHAVGEAHRAAAEPRQARAGSPERARRLEDLRELLGDGDLERTVPAQKALVLAPWGIFACSLLLWALLRHRLRDACVAAAALASLASAALVLTWCVGRRRGPLSLLALGALCLLATVAGACVGELGYVRHWRQVWWLQTGRRFELTRATTPAAARRDAAVLGFWDATRNRTLGGAAVDHARAAGHKDGHFYCVAPVLSPGAAGAGLARVNYWAVGIDCCQHLGSFACDDARSPDGAFGVVMLDAGFPCPGCNAAGFRAAVEKAEKVHGLVSSADALLVRWVRDPAEVASGALWQALLFVALSLLLGFLACWLLGSLAWYYGLGRGAVPGGGLWSARRHKQVV